MAVKLYDAYKRLFNNKYDPTIYGHEVELYVEPDNINANSNGMYSLNNGWLKFPENADIPELDEQELHALVSEYDNKIQDADTIDDIDSIIDDLYILRQQSILKDGEYGLGNQCFKEIRNMGLLQELKDKKTQLENKSMSLTESVQELSDFNTIANYLDNLPTKYKKQIIELCNLLSASDAAFANKIIKELGLKFYANRSGIWVRQGRNSDYLDLNKLHIPEYSKNKFKESTKVSSISLNWHNSNFYDTWHSKDYYKECMDEVRKLGLEDNVRFVTDFLANDESMKYLQACDVLTMPYKPSKESASGAIRFCLAALRPIITTKQPIFDEFKDCTEQIEQTDPELICQAIMKMMQNDEVKHQVENEKKHVENTSWYNIAKRFYNLYTKIIK